MQVRSGAFESRCVRGLTRMPVCGSAGANDNCLRNTEQLERTLAIEGVPRDSPIYVATDEQLMNRTVGVQSELGSLHELALRKLRSYYPRLILRQSIAPELVGRPREFRAAVDFYIAQSATRFIGNSVSTFSAHLLMQREYWGLDAQKGRAFADFHYNGGSVPLQEVQFGSKAFCTEMDVEEDGRSRPPRSDATEASCYAERYPDLHAAFCKNTTCDTAGLKAHYKNDGKAESRSYGCETPCMHIHSKADGPARPLKWVFTVNAASADVFVEMAKVAVTSARQATSLVPVCIFLGPPGSLSSWLTAHGVRVIFHEPPWRARLLESLKWAGKSLLEISPLFKDETALVSAFARVDIPVLGFADPYVFYADVDVLFLRDITLQDFYTHGSKHRSRRSSLLPFAFAVGTEAVDSALISYQKDWNHPARIVSGGNIVEHQARVMYGNTGVMLLNVDTMRRTHRHFVSWLFSDANIEAGMSFGNFGPVDQGAYNQFYQGMFDVHESPRWNWKPYWGGASTDKNVSLVHFHGPKPPDYAAYLQQPPCFVGATGGQGAAIRGGFCTFSVNARSHPVSLVAQNL